MPRAKKADTAGPDLPSDQPESMRSEEVMVVPPAQEEPVRCGGHVLTDRGWVLEGTELDPEPEQDAASEGDAPAPASGTEQE
jgi:hypothetical protein